jgi:DNA-binding CsgD family transcriptional regulator
MVVLEAQEKRNGNGDDLLKVAFLVGWCAGDEMHLPRVPEMICRGLGASAASISVTYTNGRQSRVYQYPAPVASVGGEAASTLGESASFHFTAPLGAIGTLTIAVDADPFGSAEQHALTQLSSLLAQALTAVLVSQKSRQVLGEPFSNLTDREWEVLEALESADNESAISALFQFSRHTVHTYIRHVYRKLRVGTRLEALYCVRQARARFRDAVAQRMACRHRD